MGLLLQVGRVWSVLQEACVLKGACVLKVACVTTGAGLRRCLALRASAVAFIFFKGSGALNTKPIKPPEEYLKIKGPSCWGARGA